MPGQIAVAGFGDFDVARCSWPRLTTTAVDCLAIGERTAEIALAAIDARDRREAMAPVSVVVDYKVIGRETT